MTELEMFLMRKRLRLTGQQAAFLAALVEAPDGRVSRAAMEEVIRSVRRVRREHNADPGCTVKTVKCLVNRRLPPNCGAQIETACGPGKHGGAPTIGYILPPEGRDFVLRSISEAQRSYASNMGVRA